MIPDINLMPQIEKETSDLKFIYLVTSLATILIALLLIWIYFRAANDLTTLTAERTALAAVQSELQHEISLYDTLKQGTLEQSVAFVERVSYPVTPIIDEANALLPQNTYLRSYEFSDTSVRITVDFETFQFIASYVKKLNGSAFFEDVQLGSVRNFRLNPTDEEKPNNQLFEEVPRYTVELNLAVNRAHLAVGGDR